MSVKRTLVEIAHDEGYGEHLLLHINSAFGGKDMRAERIVTIRESAPPGEEKPKQYRPFANATEFKPHREKWFNPKELPDHYIKTIAYNNRNHWNGEESDTWEQMFDKYVFEDGTPFGVEIVE